MKSKIKILLLASLLLMSNLAKSEVPGPPVAPVKDCNQYKMQIDELRLKIAAQKKALARLANTPSTLARHEMFNCNKIMEELQVQKAIAQNHYMQCTGSNVKYKNAQQLEKKAAAEKAAAEKAAAEKAAAEKATSTKSQAQIDAQEKRANLNANRARNDEFQAKRQADKIMKENEEILKRNKIKSELDKTGMAAADQEQLIKLNEAQRKAQVKANKPASDKANKEGIEREAAANQAAAAKARALKEEKGEAAFAKSKANDLNYNKTLDAAVRVWAYNADGKTPDLNGKTLDEVLNNKTLKENFRLYSFKYQLQDQVNFLVAVHDKYNPKIIYDRFFRPGAAEVFNGHGNNSYDAAFKKTLLELDQQKKWDQMNFLGVYHSEIAAVQNESHFKEYVKRMNAKAEVLRARRR